MAASPWLGAIKDGGSTLGAPAEVGCMCFFLPLSLLQDNLALQKVLEGEGRVGVCVIRRERICYMGSNIHSL